MGFSGELLSPSRRAFAKLMTALAALPLVPVRLDAASPPDGSRADAANWAVPRALPQDVDEQVAELLTEVIRVRYGDRLSADQLEGIRRTVGGKVSGARELTQYELPSAVEPNFVFRAYRREG